MVIFFCTGPYEKGKRFCSSGRPEKTTSTDGWRKKGRSSRVVTMADVGWTRTESYDLRHVWIGHTFFFLEFFFLSFYEKIVLIFFGDKECLY